MAYTASELRLMVPNFAGGSGAPQIWSLQGTDAFSSVRAANFISDALVRGMRKGDILIYTQWDSLTTKATMSGQTISSVLAVASTGADLSDGTAVTVTNT